MIVIRVALDVPVFKLFDYLSVDATEADIGARVLVRFGNRRLVGLIVEVATKSELPDDRLKTCERILRDIPPLPKDWIELARFCSNYYQAPIGAALLGALPPRLRRVEPLPESPRSYAITQAGRLALEALPARQKSRRRLLETLRLAPLGSTSLAKIVRGSRAHIKDSLNKGWIAEQALSITPPNFTVAHELNGEQSEAIKQVCSELNRFASFLLLGITGSGKTEVYLNLIAKTLQAGRQALILVPEIALTPSLEALFRARFPETRLCLQHSGMGQAERVQSWLEASQGASHIILGTRLAVFIPIPRLGLIVVDEEQDSSYKQQEGLRYSARDLAIFRARQADVPVLLCSATPSLETLYRAQTGRYRILRLTRRAHQSARLPAIHLIDTRKNLLREGLSAPLLTALAQRLERQEQSLLFLNRRGYAPVLACTHCGWVSGCPRCSVRLVVHLSRQQLSCHHCGFEARIPRACPTCGNVDITPLGRGTQRVESEVAEKFPLARIVRIDSDSAGRHIKGLLETVRSGEADILIGTQLLAKGHHFERVTLVGVLNADAGLFAADYRAPERLFAQLQQISGRAGRAELPGEVFVQTRYPDHPLYRALLQQDYEGYAQDLLKERKIAGFPPFVHEAALRAQASSMESAISFLRQAASLAPASAGDLTIFDPAPASLARLSGLERALMVIQSSSRPQLQAFLHSWNQTLSANRTSVRWHFDVDPIEF